MVSLIFQSERHSSVPRNTQGLFQYLFQRPPSQAKCQITSPLPQKVKCCFMRRNPMAHLLLQTEAKCCEKKMQMPSSIFHIGSSSLCWQLSLLLQNIDRSDRPQLFVGQYALSNKKAALHEETCPNGHSSSSYRSVRRNARSRCSFHHRNIVHCVNKCCMASPHFRMKRQHPLRRNAKWVVLTL